MKKPLLHFWKQPRERLHKRLHNRLRNRLKNGPAKRFVRCPACKSVQSIPAGRGQSKVVCRRCGEIYLRRT